MKRTIVFTASDGGYAGKVRVTTRGVSRKSKHFGKFNGSGPTCPEPGCGQPFAPICPDPYCEGNRIPRNITRVEVGWEPRPKRERPDRTKDDRKHTDRKHRDRRPDRREVHRRGV